MRERDFVEQVGRLYQEPPASNDEREFLAALDARLTAHVRRRRRWLACSGLLGACVTVGVLLQANGIATMQSTLVRAWQSIEDAMGSMETFHLAMGAGAAIAALALRELVRLASEVD